MKKRIYCICIQASSKTEEDRKSLRVFSPSLMKVSHAVFVGFLSLLLHSLPTPTSPYPLLLPSSLFPKVTSKRQLEKEGKEIFVDHRWTSENGVFLESTSPPPEGEKKGKNSSTTGRQPRMEFTNLSLVLNLSLLLSKPIRSEEQTS